MTDIPGIKQPKLNALPQIGDRMTFIYVGMQPSTEEMEPLLQQIKTALFIFQPLLSLY